MADSEALEPDQPRRGWERWLRSADGMQPRVRGSQSEDPATKRRRLNERLRAAFMAGAEEQSRRALGRGLTGDELERVLRRYPGDVGPKEGWE